MNFRRLTGAFLDAIRVAAQEENSPDDLTRVLIFINEVSRVVDQAFSDVLATLIKYKNLTDADLAPERLGVLAHELQSLRTREHYREAGDICGQLRVLNEKYKPSIKPILQRNFGQDDLKQTSHEFSGSSAPDIWEELFNLLAEREGSIVSLVSFTIMRLQGALYEYTKFHGFSEGYWGEYEEVSLLTIRAAATEASNEIGELLSEIQSLKNNILGLSGKQGFLELVNTERYKIRETITYMTTHDNSKHVSINNSPGAIANVADFMANVSNHVNQNINHSQEPTEIKELVKQLTAQVTAISASIVTQGSGDEQVGAKVQQMGGDLRTLSDEMAKPEPRRAWYELSLKGIKEAAEAVGEIGQPVIQTVAKLMPLLLAAS